MSELILVKNEALHAINNLKKWMQPQHVERNLVSLSVNLFPITSRSHIIGIIQDFLNLLSQNILSRCLKEGIVPAPPKQIKTSVAFRFP